MDAPTAARHNGEQICIKMPAKQLHNAAVRHTSKDLDEVRPS